MIVNEEERTDRQRRQRVMRGCDVLFESSCALPVPSIVNSPGKPACKQEEASTKSVKMIIHSRCNDDEEKKEMTDRRQKTKDRHRKKEKDEHTPRRCDTTNTASQAIGLPGCVIDRWKNE